MILDGGFGMCLTPTATTNANTLDSAGRARIALVAAAFSIVNLLSPAQCSVTQGRVVTTDSVGWYRSARGGM